MSKLAFAIALSLAVGSRASARAEMLDAGPVDAGAPVVPFHLPTPAGWRTETIPFPLGFAPSLSYAGVEELRFSPEMFSAGKDGFFTYAFVWWLDGEVALTPERLASDLQLYFEGLAKAVEKPERYDAKKAAAKASLKKSKATRPTAQGFEGKVSAYDAFRTHARVDLNTRVEVFRCPGRKNTVAVFLVSPKAPTHEVWKTLGDIDRGFACPS
jgi:hypothetical protein